MSLHSPVRAAAVLLVTLAACAASSPSSGSYDAAVDVPVDVPPDAPLARSSSEWRDVVCYRRGPSSLGLCTRIPGPGDWCDAEANEVDAGVQTARWCLERYVPVQMRLDQPYGSRVGDWVLRCPGLPPPCGATCGEGQRVYHPDNIQAAIWYAWLTGTCWPAQ